METQTPTFDSAKFDLSRPTNRVGRYLVLFVGIFLGYLFASTPAAAQGNLVLNITATSIYSYPCADNTGDYPNDTWNQKLSGQLTVQTTMSWSEIGQAVMSIPNFSLEVTGTVTVSAPNFTAAGCAQDLTPYTGAANGQIYFSGPSNGNPGGITISSGDIANTTANFTNTFYGNVQFTATGATASASAPDANDPSVTDSETLTITVVQPSGSNPISITPASLAPATVGEPYPPVQFEVSGGTPPYVKAVVTGTIPPGMQFTNGGELEGTPTAAGTYQFTLTVTDSAGLIGTDNLTLVVNNAALTISPTQVPSATVDKKYSVRFQATGGTPPYTWSWSGSIPGMQFTSGSGDSAGLLQGTPTTPDNFSFSVTVTDATGAQKTVNLTLVVDGGGLTLLLKIADANNQPLSRIDPTLQRKTSLKAEGSILMYAGTKGLAYITVTEERAGKPVTDSPQTTVHIKADPSRWHPDHPDANLANVNYKDLDCSWALPPPVDVANNTCVATVNSGSVSADLTVTATAIDTNTSTTVTSNAGSLGVWLSTSADAQNKDPNRLVPVGDTDLIIDTPSHQRLGNYANPIMAEFLTDLESRLHDLTAIPEPGVSCASKLLPLTLTGISLPGGGVFDVGGCDKNGEGCLWNYNPPHNSHQAGGDVDIGVHPIPALCRGILEKAIVMAAGSLIHAKSYVEPGNSPTSPTCQGQLNESTGCHWHVRLNITGSVSADSSLRIGPGTGQNTTAHAQNAPGPATVGEQVQFDSTSNLFSYSYSLINTLPTKGSVDTFEVFSGATVSSVQNPAGWISGPLNTNQGLMWAATSYDPSAADDVQPILPLSALPPGAAAHGFGFKSKLPPAPILAAVSTFAPMVGFDSEEDLEAAFDELPDNATTVENFTVAPVASVPSSPDDFLNLMQAFVMTMAHAGWITSEGVAASIDQQLNVISGSVSAGAKQTAINDLTNFMNSVSSSAGLTTDARNVLYFDAKYLTLVLKSTVTPPAGCASYPSGFVPFSSVAYITSPDSAGDKLVVGSVPVANLATIKTLPPPSSANQEFCGKVNLGGGYIVTAYLPTAAERQGDFSSFAGLLINPENNQPFPGGIIPGDLLGQVYAWRIPAQTITTGSNSAH